MSKKIFGIEDYNEIHELVLEYKNGNKEVSKRIIDNFSCFLNKYVALIKYGKYNLDHYSTRSFMKLFITKPEDRALISAYKYKHSAKLVADKTVSKIQDIFSNMEDIDLKNELYIILLTMCNTYKDTKPSFHYSVDRNFHYYAYRHFEKASKDPLARGYLTNSKSTVTNSDGSTNNDDLFTVENCVADPNVELEMDMLLNEVEVHYNLSMSNATYVNQKNISIYDNEFFNTNWINGITCSNVFKALTPFERNILVMWYIENKTDSEIAEEYGVCRCTINKRRAKAKDKLREEIIKNKKYKINI